MSDWKPTPLPDWLKLLLIVIVIVGVGYLAMTPGFLS